MGTVIIFFLTAVLSAFGAVSALKNKNLLGLFFAVGSVAIFGWFSIMTLIGHGIPGAH